MPNSRYYSSIAAATNLQVTANPGDTSIQVASSSGWPGSFPFILSVDYGAANEELVLATSGGPNIFQVTRAYDGTSASTHNAGAVVRHVSSAIDFTDSRTHESSATGVHGISGQFVDTVSAQSIANKTINTSTLNSPTIAGAVNSSTATFAGGTFTAPTITNPTVTGGGSLAGAFTGTPSFGGVVTFLQGIAAKGLASVFSRANASDSAIQVKTDAATNPQLNVGADGALGWGSGSGSSDAILTRTGVAAMGLTGSLTASGNVNAGGGVTAAGTVTGTNLSLTSQTYTPFTPVWNGLDGATFSNNVGWYTKYGKIVFYRIYGVFSTGGPGTGGVSIMLPTVPDRSDTARQVVGHAYYEGLDTKTNWPDINCEGPVIVFATDTGATTAGLRNYKGTVLQNDQLRDAGFGVTSIVTIEGFYREV